MNYRKIPFLFIIVCITFYVCLSETSLFEEVSKLPTFVDKTQLIKSFLTRTHAHKNFLLSCPKGFGKSVNLDMMRRFCEFNINRTDRNRTKDLFKNLKIGRDQEFFKTHFGRYAVISIDLHIPTNADTYGEIFYVIRDTIKRLYSKYDWLYEKFLRNKTNLSKAMTKAKTFFESMLGEKQLPSTEFFESDLFGIEVLCGVIYKYYTKHIILLVDEYDSPILRTNFSTNDTADLIMHVLSMLPKEFTGNTSGIQYENAYALFAGISNNIGMEGCTEVPRNPWVVHPYNFLDNHHFTEFCGFTENEMENIFNQPKTHVTKEEKLLLKNCYDGYISDKDSIHIYNPSYLHADITETKKTDPHKKIVNCKGLLGSDTPAFEKFQAYLKSEYILSIVANLIRNRPFTFHKQDDFCNRDLEELGVLADNQTCWVDASQMTFDIFFSLLFQYGYLTKVNNFKPLERKTWYKAPNHQVTAELGAILTRYLESYPSTSALFDVSTIFSNLLRNQVKRESAEDALKEALTELFKPVYKIVGVGQEELSYESYFHSEVYTSALYGYWIQKLYYIADGHARLGGVARSRKVNILMESFDRKSFLFVEIVSGSISDILKDKHLPNNLTYKTTLVLHEEHPEEFPETLLYLLIKPLQNKTIQVEFFPPLRLIQNISIDTGIQAIYEGPPSCP